jgi:hypothetical protein
MLIVHDLSHNTEHFPNTYKAQFTAACNVIVADPCSLCSRCDSGNSVSSGCSPQGLGHLLDAFDKAWAAYLQRFVAWKFADAAALESELIKVAIEMEASVLSKTGGDTSPDTERSEDLQVGLCNPCLSVCVCVCSIVGLYAVLNCCATLACLCVCMQYCTVGLYAALYR